MFLAGLLYTSGVKINSRLRFPLPNLYNLYNIFERFLGTVILLRWIPVVF